MKQKNPFLLVSRLCLLTAVPTRWTLNVLQATPRSRYRQEVQHPATSRGLCATPDVHVLEARGGARPGIKVPWTGKCSSGHTGLAEFLCEDKTPSTPETWRQKSSDKVSVCLSVYVHSQECVGRQRSVVQAGKNECCGSWEQQCGRLLLLVLFRWNVPLVFYLGEYLNPLKKV